MQQQPQVSATLIEDLHVDDLWIDPARPSFKQQLIARFCLQPTARIEKRRSHGGLNMGIWCLQDASRSLMLKLVTSTRCLGFPTEAERLTSLARKVPQVVHDRDLTFPIGIFRVIASDQTTRNLIVMHKAPGAPLIDIALQMVQRGRSNAFQAILYRFGGFLRRFHSRYGLQHGDCQLGNAFYDEASGRFVLIDIADMGSPIVKEGDVQQFIKSLRTFAGRYQLSMVEDFLGHFQRGYADAAAS